jgi:hypothetical protein
MTPLTPLNQSGYPLQLFCVVADYFMRPLDQADKLLLLEPLKSGDAVGHSIFPLPISPNEEEYDAENRTEVLQ